MKNDTGKIKSTSHHAAIALEIALALGLATTSVFAAAPSILKIIIQKTDGTGTNKLAVQFTEAVFSNAAHTSALAPGNFTLSGSAALAVSAVDHMLGGDTAILTLNVASAPYVSGVSGVLLVDGASIYNGAGTAFVPGSAFDLVSALVDVAQPAVSSAFTINNIAQPNTVTVPFNEALGDRMAAETPANWTLTNSSVGITYSVSSVALSTDRKKATLTLQPANPANVATYIANADANTHLKVTPSAAIKDLVGNPAVAAAVAGSGETLTLDATPPAINAVMTKINATTFMLSFSEKMAATAGSYLNYTVGGTGGATNGSLASLQANGTDVSFTVSDTSGFTSGQTLTIAPTATVTDLAGLSATGTATYTANSLTYSTTTFIEAGGNHGNIGNSIIVTLAGDTFNGNGQEFIPAGKATLTNVPAGLWANIYQKNSNQAVIELLGNAASHAAADCVSNLSLTFNPSAFTGNGTPAIANATATLSVAFYTSDSTPPAVSAFFPANNAAGVPPTSNLYLYFNEDVTATAGAIVIRKTSDNSIVETLPANSAAVAIFGRNVVISPTAPLAANTGYYIEIAAGAFVDKASPPNQYAGISGSGGWSFTTGLADIVPPAVASYFPANSSTGIANSTDLNLDFDEQVVVGAGNITIYNIVGPALVETIAATDTTKVKLSPNPSGASRLSINPGNTLVNGQSYYVNIAAGAFKDRANNNYAGISNNSTWAFTVAAADVTPPKVLNLTLSSVTSSSAAFSATIDEAGTGYYATLLAGDPAPTAAQVIAGSVGVAKGSVPGMADDVAQTFTASGLAASTTYKIYFTAKDAALNIGGGFGWGNISFTTSAGSPPPDTGGYEPPPPAVTPPPIITPPPVETPSGPSTPVTTPGQVISNPPPNVTVDTSGAIVITAPSGPAAPPIVISPAAPENALVKLPANQPVSITTDKTTLQYTDKQGDAQLLVRTVNGQPQLEVAKGIVAIASSTPGNTIPVISVDLKSVGTVTTSTNADNVVVVKTDKSAVVFVDTGKVDYKGPGQDAKGVPVYGGENAKLNNASGQLNQITLGSRNGESQVPGDPLPPQQGYAPDTHVPKLDGNLPRFNNSVSLLDILRDAIQDVLGDTSGKISYDKTSGVVTYTIGNHGYRLIPLGEIQVLLNQISAASVTTTAGGAYSLASKGIQMSLSGAVGYFSDLQQAVKALDSNGEITLKSSGTLEMKVSGNRYAGIPAVAASLPAAPTPIPGFETGTDGLAVFRDHLGVLQTLYPAFLDIDSVAAAIKSVDPAAGVTNNGNGTLTVTLSGQTYTFLPEYQVTAASGSPSSQSWWVDGGLIYIRNADNSVQGFRLQ